MTTATRTDLVSTNPATGEPVGSVPVTPPAEIADVLRRSRTAQSAWASVPLEQRIALLRQVIPVLDGRIDEIGALVTAEMGKPIAEGVGEVGKRLPVVDRGGGTAALRVCQSIRRCRV